MLYKDYSNVVNDKSVKYGKESEMIILPKDAYDSMVYKIKDLELRLSQMEKDK